MKKHTIMKTVILAFVAIISLSLIISCATSFANKEKARAHINMGIAYVKSGQYTSALKEFLIAEKITPKDAEVHYYLGVSYYGKGLREKAAEEFNKALSLNPEYSEAHNYLGTVYLETGQYEKAIEEFQRALSNVLYETPAVALNNMGWAYYKKRNNQRAIEQYQGALNKEPDTILIPVIHNNMGLAYLDAYNINGAIQHFQTAIEVAPNFIESRYWLGISYLKKGDRKRALKELQSVFKTNPDSRFENNP
jgi:tetratricopeptide (TPR) repeat protein